MSSRFLTLADVTEVLNISSTQAYALVRSGELPAIQVGGRGQWRVEASELETYIQRMYAETRAKIDGGSDATDAAGDLEAGTRPGRAQPPSARLGREGSA